MGNLLSGRPLAESINHRTTRRIEELRSRFEVQPRLVVVTTEEGGLLKKTQIELHERAATALGIEVQTELLSNDATESDLIAVIERFNAKREIHGILVLLPLKKGIRQHVIFDAIDPSKEMEGVGDRDDVEDPEELVDLENESRKISSTLAAIRLLLETVGIDPIRSRNVFVAGNQVRENLVVARLLQMASQVNVQVAVAWSDDPNASKITKQADIILVSVDTPSVVDARFVKPGAAIIDFAPVFAGEKFSTKQGRMVPVLKNGVDVDSALPLAGYVAPALGGVGPVMMATMMRNLAVNYEHHMTGPT